MKLNLGCGTKMISEDGWLNVDSRKLHPDSALFLRHNILFIRDRVKDESCDEILLSDVLEHFGKLDGEQLLRDCHAMLEPGGMLEIKTPVIGLLTEWAKTHTELETAFRWFGGNEYVENCHRWVWPEADLLDLLRSIGFKVKSKFHQEDTNLVVKAVKA